MSNPLTEWLGDGGNPVDKNSAEYRSRICLNCPQNVEPSWWERHTKDPIASAIRTALELKSGMSLKVDNEERLHMCKACGCCIRLKVWTPIRHILENTGAETISKFESGCWITQNNTEL